jgi:hypothetical protein
MVFEKRKLIGIFRTAAGAGRDWRKLHNQNNNSQSSLSSNFGGQIKGDEIGVSLSTQERG